MRSPRYFFAFLILLVLAFGLVDEASAQHKKPQNLIHYDHAPYNFGFTIGINQMLFSIDYVPYYSLYVFRGDETGDLIADSAWLNRVETNPNWGFTIGIVSNLKLGRYFDLRFIPSLSFGERDLEYDLTRSFQGQTDHVIDYKPVQSTYVEFPLYVKYKSKRLNNTRAYIIGGPKYAIDLISDARRSENVQGAMIKLYSNDIYMDIGVGFDFYNEFFKFGIEAKMSYGFRNLLKQEDILFTKIIDDLRSKIFTLSFTFE